MGKEFDETFEERRTGIYGAEGLFPSRPICMRVIHASYLEQQYMLEMVEARRNGDKVEERYDLFSGLLDAEQDESGNGAGLSDDELIGLYLTLQSFSILGKRLTLPFRKHVRLSFCRTRGWIFPFFTRVALKHLPTDHGAYSMLYVRPVGSLP